MQTKNYTNLKTSRAISKVVDIESEVVLREQAEEIQDMYNVSGMIADEICQVAESYADKREQIVRDSERNRIFAIMRHIGIKTGAREVMNIYNHRLMKNPINSTYQYFEQSNTYSFTDCLNVIEKIEERDEWVEREGKHVYRIKMQHKLLDAYLADNKDMSKEGGEVEKLMISLL